MDNTTILITEKEHEYFCTLKYKEYYFGSHLFKTNAINSDKDIIRIYKPETAHQNNVYKFEIPGIVTILWVTESEFRHQLIKANSTLFSDVAIFNNLLFNGNRRNYKTIKSYLGVAKRDCMIHDTHKKTLHAYRNLTIAKKLIFRQETPIDFIDMKHFINSLDETQIQELRCAILDDCKKLREKIKDQLNNGYIQLNWFGQC